jgi:predicted nucleic acid-binding protein
MMMSRELATLDTNVVVYALYADTEHHRANGSLSTRDKIKTPFCASPPSAYRVLCGCDQSRRVTEAKSPEAVLDVIANLIAPCLASRF